MDWNTFAEVAPTNYLLKMGIVVALTPLIYAVHAGIRKFI
jgi:hypothetical protein